MSNELYLRQLLSALAVAIAICIGFLCGNADAAPLGTSTMSAFKGVAEPFGIGTSELRHGGLFDKWRAITRALPREMEIVARCRDDMDGCPEEAKRFIAIVDRAQGRAILTQIAEINRAINLNIRPMDDLSLYGVAERWSTPLVTFTHGAGDCEDYAIAKYAALRQIGIPEEDLRLVVVYDRQAQEHHAVAAVRHAGRWLVLDNRSLAVQEDADIAHFTPMFTLDSQGVKRIAAAPRKAPSTPASNFDTARIDRNAVSAAAAIAPATPFLL
jgi:predicted transglutaminase-like cysteine proteinase